ncbi:hypothetical protein YH65_03425 [Sulfurovum lithotrophicum]|uniref:GNAT family N-acetyltransferase n=1 Tax=Sulfurovum lithotrophicum TaxID=206403 RepID=A0A7U4RQD2_9BACT|nr:hypothetical protein [Sulfurovum lithotrophicum]AKF24546.1 hypothetical protein YH65_03425 [Sulfurovum lithotrophicum]
MTEPSIFHLLTEVYSLHLAVTEQDIESVKQVRKEALLPAYQTYADIEDESAFLYNRDDEQSFIYLLQHNATQKYVGTIRVFFVNDATPIQKIPMQIYGHVKEIESYVAEHPVCEVSRLALSGSIEPYEGLSGLRLRTYLTVGLMSAIGINAFLYPCNSIFAIMEPALYRILKRQGIDFEPVGPAVEYYGKRIPHMIGRKDLIFGSKEILGEITLHYLSKLCQDPDRFWAFVDRHPYLDRSNMHLSKICQCFEKATQPVSIPSLYIGT